MRIRFEAMISVRVVASEGEHYGSGMLVDTVETATLDRMLMTLKDKMTACHGAAVDALNSRLQETPKPKTGKGCCVHGVPLSKRCEGCYMEYHSEETRTVTLNEEPQDG